MLNLDTTLVPASFVVGDLTFHAYDNRVYKDGKDIGIHGQKEYQIISRLARKAHACADGLVLHEELFDFVYYGAVPTSNSLNVFVCTVRKKLQKVNSCVSIETINGKGYCLMTPPDKPAYYKLAAA